MSMEMDWKFNDDGSMECISFHGLSGIELVGNLKSSLELLRIANPAVAFANRVKTGEYDSMPNDEYDNIYKAVDFMASLWRYPDAREGDLKQCEMNVLMLLANALETVSRQQAIINRMEAERKVRNYEKEMMDAWEKAKR